MRTHYRHGRPLRCLTGLAAASAAALSLVGCPSNEPPPPAAAPRPAPPAQVSQQPGAGATIAPPTGKVTEGGTFNKLFPKDEPGYNVVYSQEKKGFAQAVVEHDKKKVATLSISDVAANPEAVQKYNAASQKIGGFPSVAVGTQGTAVLVGGRYQVQVRSEPNSNFSEQDRENWISKFKLDELARMGGK